MLAKTVINSIDKKNTFTIGQSPDSEFLNAIDAEAYAVSTNANHIYKYVDLNVDNSFLNEYTTWLNIDLTLESTGNFEFGTIETPLTQIAIEDTYFNSLTLNNGCYSILNSTAITAELHITNSYVVIDGLVAMTALYAKDSVIVFKQATNFDTSDVYIEFNNCKIYYAVTDGTLSLFTGETYMALYNNSHMYLTNFNGLASASLNKIFDSTFQYGGHPIITDMTCSLSLYSTNTISTSVSVGDFGITPDELNRFFNLKLINDVFAFTKHASFDLNSNSVFLKTPQLADNTRFALGSWVPDKGYFGNINLDDTYLWDTTGSPTVTGVRNLLEFEFPLVNELTYDMMSGVIYLDYYLEMQDTTIHVVTDYRYGSIEIAYSYSFTSGVTTTVITDNSTSKLSGIGFDAITFLAGNLTNKFKLQIVYNTAFTNVNSFNLSLKNIKNVSNNNYAIKNIKKAAN